jgi:hypothetical protein
MLQRPGFLLPLLLIHLLLLLSSVNSAPSSNTKKYQTVEISEFIKSELSLLKSIAKQQQQQVQQLEDSSSSSSSSASSSALACKGHPLINAELNWKNFNQRRACLLQAVRDPLSHSLFSFCCFLLFFPLIICSLFLCLVFLYSGSFHFFCFCFCVGSLWRALTTSQRERRCCNLFP